MGMELTKTASNLPAPIDTVTYSFGGATHHIHILAKMSPDLVLTHQAKTAGFFLKTGTPIAELVLDPVPRAAKDLLRS